MNSVNITGRLGRDIEIRSAGQSKVGEFSIAVKDRDNTYWIDCIAWNKQAEFIRDYSGKGLRVEITGKLQQDTWEDQQGSKRSKLKVVVLNVEPIDWKEKTESVENDDFVPTDGDNRIPF